MDLPRAVIRYRGWQAVAAAMTRRRHDVSAWLRPRAAPLAITAVATMCMLAGLDLIAHDFRKLHDPPIQRQPAIYLISMDQPVNVIPVELVTPPTATVAR